MAQCQRTARQSTTLQKPGLWDGQCTLQRLNCLVASKGSSRPATSPDSIPQARCGQELPGTPTSETGSRGCSALLCRRTVRGKRGGWGD